MERKTLRKLNKIKKLLHPKRLKIAEQILIVLFVALLIPMIISGLVINNINQQAMRHQLQNSAVLIANLVSDEIDVFFKISTVELQQINNTLKYLPNETSKSNYLKEIKEYSHYDNIFIVNTEEDAKIIKENNISLNKMFFLAKIICISYNGIKFNS